VRIRQAVAGTHAGAVRSFNEDAVLRLGRVPLYAIADGMGGPGAGDVAAQVSLDVIKRHAMAIRDRNTAVARARTPENRRALHKTFETVFNRASRHIREEAARRDQSVMGASLVLATVVHEYAYVCHIGDARAYLFRGGSLQRLTEDHTLAELKLRRGRITREEYQNHPERHVLYQSLGAPFELDVDLAEVRLEHGDILLLCSDGVVGALDDEAIARGIAPEDLNNSLRGLLRSCIQARCADNISAVLLGMEGDAPTEVAAREEVPTNPRGTAPVAEPPSIEVRGTLFAGLSPDERRVVAPYLEERRYSDGDRIVAEGDTADALHVLVAGRVEVTRAGVPLGERTEGVLGELSFERDALQIARVEARSPCITLVLTRDRFRALLAEHPAVAARVAMGVADAGAELTRRLGERLGAVARALEGHSG
jgi:PPM family protein phosphatase